MKLWSVNALSDETGIDRRTIKKRLAKLTPAKTEKDRSGHASPLYHGFEAFPALYGANGHAEVSTIDESEARLKAAQAGREELKLQREREEVIETETVYRLWEAICTAVRGKVDRLPSKVESRLGLTPKQRKALEHETDEILGDLAKPIDYFKPVEGAEAEQTE